MNRQKTGGRQTGTPNRRTQEIASLLSSLDCAPIEGMAEIAQVARDSNDLRLAGQMYKELAQYVAPKRRSVEILLDEPESTVEEMTDEELEAALKEAQAGIHEQKKFMEFVKDEIEAGRIVEVEKGNY